MKKIEVKAKHIKGGSRCNPWFCPVATAIREQVGLDALVTSIDAYVVIPTATDVGGFMYNRDVYVSLPRSASRFIRKYDGGGEVKPFNFMFDL